MARIEMSDDGYPVEVTDTRRSPEPLPAYQRRKAIVKKRVKIAIQLDADSESEALSLQKQLADHLKSGKPVEEFRVYG